MFQYFRSSKVLFALLLVSLACCQESLKGAEQKIATVDLAVVFDGYWRTQAFRETLKGRDEVTVQEMQKSIADYNKELESVRKLQQEFNDSTQNKDQQEKLKPKLQQQLDDLKIQEQDVNL